MDVAEALQEILETETQHLGPRPNRSKCEATFLRPQGGVIVRGEETLKAGAPTEYLVHILYAAWDLRAEVASRQADW